MKNDITNPNEYSEIVDKSENVVRQKSHWLRFCKWFQSRDKLKYRPRRKPTNEVHFKRLFQAKSNSDFGQTKEEKIVVSTCILNYNYNSNYNYNFKL